MTTTQKKTPLQTLPPACAVAKLLQTVLANPMVLMPLQSILTPEQSNVVISEVTSLTLKKPLDKTKIDGFLLSLQEAQIHVLKHYFTCEQSALLDAAITDATDTLRDPPSGG